MPTIPDLTPAPNLPGFYWDARSRTFRDQNGQPVSPEVVRAALDDVVNGSAEMMAALSEQLRAAKIDLTEWETSMMAEISVTLLASAVIAAGGWLLMTQADFGRVETAVRDEYGRLRRFAAQIARGEQRLDGTLARRARMYGQTGRGLFYRFQQAGFARLGYDEERSVLTPADHCEGERGCVEEAAKGWQPLGAMIPIGQRRCLSNCKCRVEYRNSKTGEVAII